MPISANQTKLSYKVGSGTTFTEIPYLMEVPELGGAPEKIDCISGKLMEKRRQLTGAPG